MSVVTDFWELPASARRQIVGDLGDLTDMEMRMPEHHRNLTAFRRIAERGWQNKLADMVAQRKGTDSADQR